MIAIAGLIFGALFGGWKARKRGGNRLDVLQYAGVHALIFGLAGLFVTVMLERWAF